jgi:inosose dehydratase
MFDIEYEGWLSLEIWHRKDNNPKRTMIEDTKISIDYINQLIKEVESKSVK